MTEEMKDYGSPRWSAEIIDCSMPLTFDSYSNCSFGCVYCFSQYQRALGESKNSYLASKIAAVKVERVKRIFTDLDNPNNQFAEYIRQGKTIQWWRLVGPILLHRKEIWGWVGTSEILP